MHKLIQIKILLFQLYGEISLLDLVLLSSIKFYTSNGNNYLLSMLMDVLPLLGF